MLPTLTAPNIDVTATKLQNAQREEARPGMDVAAGLQPAVSGALALKKSLDENNELEAAKVFQREYLDKGLAGAKKLVSEAGLDGKINPDIYFHPKMTPQETQQAVVMVAKAVKDEAEKAGIEAANTEYADIVSKGVKQDDGTYRPATKKELDAARIKSAAKSGKGEEAITSIGKENTALQVAEIRKQIAADKIDFDRAQKVLDRAVAWARVNKMKTTPGVNMATLKKYQDEKTEADKEIAALEASGDAILDPNKLSDARTRRRAVLEKIMQLESKIPADDGTETGGNKKGTYNSATGQVEYK